MLIVRGTKKLRDRMKQAPLASATDESTTALGDWFATALFWKPQVALLVNARTMIPVFTPLAPAGKLLDRAPEAIGQVLAAHDVPRDAIDSEMAAMRDVRLAPTNDRQVVGVMNEFAFQGEGAWGTRDPDLFAMSMRLSDLILGPLMKRHGTPADELAACFTPGAKVIAFPGADAAPVATTGRTHQLKVTLRDTNPPIWRRVVVDGGETLAHLHSVIQAAFGWWDAHLHAFEIDDESYGIPHVDDWTPVKDERRVSIDQTLGEGGRRARYIYDFGDHWEHDIVVEKTTPANDDTVVPDCIGGARACPPEDCGGPWGYRELLEILADPTHPEYAERREWLDHPIYPDEFDMDRFELDFERQVSLERQGLTSSTHLRDD